MSTGLRLVCCLAAVCLLSTAGAQQPGSTQYEVARLKATLQQVLQDHERLLGLLEQNRQVTNSILKRLEDVEAKVGRAGEGAASGNALRAEIRSLKSELAAERKAREKAVAELIRSVSEEISRASRETGPGSVETGPSQGVYAVVAGDTLSVIAQAFGVTVEGIKRANNLDSDIIRVGQKLNIPARQ